MPEKQYRQIWENTKKLMEKHLTSVQLNVWFSDSKLESIDGYTAVVVVENNSAKENIHKYAEDALIISLREITKIDIKTIEYKIVKRSQQHNNNNDVVNLFNYQENEDYQSTTPSLSNPSHSHTSSTNDFNNTKTDSIEEPDFVSANLNPKFTFDNFIVGKNNRMAYKAAEKIAESPGHPQLNPFYVYGGVGLGKTHLIQAIGNTILTKEPQKKILYTSCENFVNDFVNHITNKRSNTFKNKYRSIDLFLIDDIQFIAGKEGTQEEFFHTYEALSKMGKQIIMTSDKPPEKINNLEERLISRFTSGLVADIQAPNYETRVAILQSKGKEKNIELSDELYYYIAENCETNIRELEGMLNTLKIYLESEEITNPTKKDLDAVIKKVGKDKAKPDRKTRMEQICGAVCAYYQVEMTDIKGASRIKELIKPRQVLMYLMKNELSMTFPAIGKELGGRDHTTIMYGCEKVTKELKKSEDMFSELEEVKEQYYSVTK